MAIAKKPKRDHSAAKDMMGDAAAEKFIAGADASHEEARREDDKKIQTTPALTATCSSASTPRNTGASAGVRGFNSR